MIALFLGSQVFMFAAMIMRYPQVYELGGPSALVLPVAVPGYPRLRPPGRASTPSGHGPGRRGRRLVDVALVLLAVANVAQWPRHRDLSLHSDWYPKIHDQTKRLQASLRSGAADPGLYGAYREFLHFAWDLSPASASRISAEVREGPGLLSQRDPGGARVRLGARGAVPRVSSRPGPATYALRGDLWLRPGEPSPFRGPGGLSAASEERGGRGRGRVLGVPEAPAGRTELAFDPDADERDVGSKRDRKAASFGLFRPSSSRSNDTVDDVARS